MVKILDRTKSMVYIPPWEEIRYDITLAFYCVCGYFCCFPFGQTQYQRACADDGCIVLPQLAVVDHLINQKRSSSNDARQLFYDS